MSCGCCAHERRNFCSQPRCDWSPNKFDYQLSNPRYGGHHDHGHDDSFHGGQNRTYSTFNRYGGSNCCGGIDRRDAYFARAGWYGYGDILHRRVNAGGFDQPAPWNDDGDQ